MSLLKKLLIATISISLFFSCSQGVMNEDVTGGDEAYSGEGSRGFGKVYGVDEVKAFSDKYFSQGSNGYLRSVNKNGINGYYINMQGEGDEEWTPKHVSTNEAMGYGMRLAAMRINISSSSYDRNKYANIFDGLWRVQHSFPSYTTSQLHSWVIPADFNPLTTKGKMVSSATDGELDTAYALLLMDKRYGTSRSVKYKDEAKKIILALGKTIRSENVNGRTYTYLPTGDWTKWGEGKYVARCSDFMPHHLKTFIRFMEAEGLTGDSAYNKYKNTLKTVKYLYANNPFSSDGMFPDFILIKGSGNILKPLPPNSPQAQALGEAVETDLYSHNASRVPWRMAEDTYFTDDEVSARAARDIWLTMKDHPYGDVFDLEGNPLNDHTSAAFSAPIAACIEPAFYLQYKSLSGRAKGACGNAYWREVNKAFTKHNNFFQGENHPWGPGYFEDSISLFSQYFMLRDSYMVEPYSTKGL